MDISKIKDAHKVFAKEFVTHWSGVKAYQTAYPDCEYDTAKVNASKLLTNTNIKAYIEYIQEDLLKLCGISVLGNINVLKEILENKESRETDRIKALEVVNKMLGLNAPEKREVTNKIDLTPEEKEARIQELNKKLKG